jgi:hypothetical protein
MNQRITKSLVWILTGFVAFIFIGSGIFKLVGGVKTVEMAQSVGGRSNLIILAFLEFVIAILFLIPRTGVVGILLMIAYMGGALAVLFVSGQPFIFLIIIQILIWITGLFRFPELGQRLLNNNRV